MWVRGRTLGRGHFGSVSLALNLQQDNEKHNIDRPSIMAVKSAKLSESHSLLKERKLLHEFRYCPYIIRYFGADSTIENGEELYNIFLEYASNGSLADRIKSTGNKGLADCEVRQHTKSILTGLQYIHINGYVHCDIKPHNILLVGCPKSCLIPRLKKETAKIADFGLSKKAKKRTKGNNLRGTPLYLAPESILSRQYKSHSDIWSLGCTVLQMITGRPPWHCDQNTEICSVMFKIGHTNQVPEIPTWVSKEAKDFLSKCLVRDPKARWTANMLLGHPFVTNRVLPNKLTDKIDDLCSADPPKPHAIMSKYRYGESKKLVAEEERSKRLDCSFLESYIPLSQQSCGFSVSKKRKTSREEIHI